MILGSKTYGFPRLIIVFYSIAVSSLIVRLYDYRSSADDFCSKSVRPPGAVLTKNPPREEFSLLSLCFCLDFAEFLVRQPVFEFFKHFFRFFLRFFTILFNFIDKRTLILYN